MISILKRYFKYISDNAEHNNDINILNLLESGKNIKILDLGCAEGVFSKQIIKKIGIEKLYVVEMIDEFIHNLPINQIIPIKANLNKTMPFKSESFDVVHSNQVLEHLYNLDNFIEEIVRILKPGGYCIISTENLASTHNIFALLLGMQPFSTTVSTKRRGIGNPLALHGNSDIPEKYVFGTHIKVITLLALQDLCKYYGLKIEKTVSSGYPPFPNFIAKWVLRLDRWHGIFITVKARKK